RFNSRITVQPFVPEFPVVKLVNLSALSSYFFTLWFHSPCQDVKSVGILLSSLKLPVKEVDYPSTGCLIRTLIKILSAEIWKDNISVTTIILYQRMGLFRRKYKAGT